MARVAPICSAMDINKLLKTSSIIGSAFVPTASFLFIGICLSNKRWPNLLSFAHQPGSITFVPVGSFIMAGPWTCWPGFRDCLSYNGASTRFPLLTIFNLSTATGVCFTSSIVASLTTEEPPIASTLKASKISSLPSLEKPYRARWVLSKRCFNSFRFPKLTVSAWCEPLKRKCALHSTLISSYPTPWDTTCLVALSDKSDSITFASS